MAGIGREPHIPVWLSRPNYNYLVEGPLKVINGMLEPNDGPKIATKNFLNHLKPH